MVESRRPRPVGDFLRALIIEDEPFIALLIEDLLRGAGYASFDFAASADDAVAAAKANCPDLIVSDFQLQGAQTGIDAIRAICACSSIPVVFVTAQASDVREQLGDVSDVPIVQKPFVAGDLEYALAAARPMATTAPGRRE
jgi:CheY-like chemotaxis protein